MNTPLRGVHEMPPAVFMKPQMKSSIWAACSLARTYAERGPSGDSERVPGSANAMGSERDEPEVRQLI